MNILILNWRCPKHPNAGGAEQVTLEHAKGWYEAGHDVYWISSFFNGAKKKETIEGIKIIRGGSQFLGVQLKAFLWYIHPNRPKVDLIVDQFHGIPFFTTIYARNKKLAFIHEIAKEVWKYNPWPKPLNLIPGYIGPLLEPLIFRVFYKDVQFLTVSESSRQDLIDIGVDKKLINVIHNGIVKPNFKRLPAKEKINTAVFLGALAIDKGVEDAIKVFAEINRKDNSWQFWVVGRGGGKELVMLKKLVKDFDIQNKVKFWGYVSEKKKYELLAKAHLMINTSFHEGWGLVNIEASSVATPVLAYKVHGLKDSIKDGKTGIFSKRGDYRDLAANALKVIRDKEKYNQLQKNALKWSKNFDWEKSRKESLEYIESL